LTAALETFERLGARPWAGRATAELRATGLARPRALERGHLSPTPQEHEIAMLAAGGMSNKQIGQRLFLSPRTVSGHLDRIFPKLGVTSRTALHGALASLPQAGDSERGSERARRSRTRASPPLSTPGEGGLGRDTRTHGSFG
jgi:DNA-binding CsgD family transcriptional regulator